MKMEMAQDVELDDYMIYCIPATEQMRIRLNDWRDRYIQVKMDVIKWAREIPGATAIQFDHTDGHCVGLAFADKPPLGWRKPGAQSPHYVPAVASQVIATRIAGQRYLDEINAIGGYTPLHTLSRELGFHTGYSWESDAGLQKGGSGMGPLLDGIKILFRGADSPIAIWGPDARKFHEMFLPKLQKRYGDSVRCTSGADVWTLPDGFEQISKTRWEFLAAQHALEREEKEKAGE